MKFSQVAPKYARALLTVAVELGKTEEYQELLTAVEEVYARMRNIFDNPTMSAQKKKAKMMELLSSAGYSVDKAFENFLKIVFEKKRQKIFPLLARYFELMRIEAQMKVPVELTMPYKPSVEELELLKSFVLRYAKREPVFDIKIDSNLIAGAVLQFEGKTFDVSVNGRMRRIVRAILEKG